MSGLVNFFAFLDIPGALFFFLFFWDNVGAVDYLVIFESLRQVAFVSFLDMSGLVFFSHFWIYPEL